MTNNVAFNALAENVESNKNTVTRFSSIPVGHKFWLNGFSYTKSNHNRAYLEMHYIDNHIVKKEYINVKKHKLVEYYENENKRIRKSLKTIKVRN